jgi:DNA polymerase bacteriophage-type
LHIVDLDIETYSSVDLKKANVYRYVTAPDFRILMCAWAVDGEPIRVELDGIPALVRYLLDDPDVTIAAHNASFERICFSRLLCPPGEFLPPSRFLDTAALAAEAGLPRSLDKAARAAGVPEVKDSAGTRLINLFSRPNRRGVRTLPEEKPEQWAEFIDYCVTDVEVLRGLRRRLPALTPTEARVYEVDQLINDRGVKLDLDLAAAAEEAAEMNKLVGELRVSKLTGVANPGSNVQMLTWLKDHGYAPANLRKESVAEALISTEDPVVREVLELRQSLALTTSKKYGAALRSANSDGRMRGVFSFFGAHTGRWASKGIQLHNLTRASVEDPEAAILDLKLGESTDDETLKALVRPMLVGPFVVVDYAQIEARVLAWLAGEQWVLDAVRAYDADPTLPDLYEVTAAQMGGLTRDQGKVAVLALGYNGSVGSLRAMGYGGPPCVADGPEAAERRRAGKTLSPRQLRAREAHLGRFPDHLCDDELYPFVDAWRAANTRITRLWRRLDLAFAEGGVHSRLLRIEARGRDRHMVLPSGRAIVYRNIGWERWFDKDKRKWKEGWRFDSPHGYRSDTYGGRLAENATQAVARDILAEALVRLEDAGYRPVAHVHDEILVETEDLAEVQKIVEVPPSWADGLPISAAGGFIANRYRKG